MEDLFPEEWGAEQEPPCWIASLASHAVTDPRIATLNLLCSSQTMIDY